MKIDVTYISIVVNRPVYDYVELTLDAQPGIPEDDECYVRMSATRGTALSWAQKTFPGMPVELVDAATGKVTILKPGEKA